MLMIVALIPQSSKAQTITQNFGSGVNAFSMDFVEIGNPGNAADTRTYHNTTTIFNAGAVAYSYNLGKYEISRDQIEKANIMGGLGISLADLSGFGGNSGNKPATGISWNEAARFVNWLNTSSGKQAAYNIDSNGNLQLWGVGDFSGNNQFRHKDAYYFLPSVDEWYKGAYYDPSKVGGAGYWRFPTSADDAPLPVVEGVTTGTAVWDGAELVGPGNITNAGGLSSYGTMAQGGNAWEWTETSYDGVNDSSNENRELRGGAWGGGVILLDATVRLLSDPAYEGNNDFGFRIASSVPEPSAFSLLAIGLGGLALLRQGRKED